MMETDNATIAAGMVLYNPDIARLEENLQSIYSQVDKVYLVDNCSGNREEIVQLLAQYPHSHFVKNASNRGIAAALNQIMALAVADGYAWVLTLDDDSVCDSDLVEQLAVYRDQKNVGILCPVAVDDAMDKESSGNNVTACRRPGCVQEIEDCITAGSLTSVESWKKIGGFDEQMFIDFVDIEFCRRLKTHGYRILRVNGTFVHQQYGAISSSFSLFGRRFYRFEYSPIRVYYSVRNQIYYMRKHRESIHLPGQILFLAGYIGKRIVFEKNRRKSLKAVIRGIRDGSKMCVR